MKKKSFYSIVLQNIILHTVYHISKPKNMMYYLNSIYIPVLVLSIIFFVSAIYLGLYVNTNDFQQGEAYKIIYIHVPSAWLSITLYTLLAICSFIFIYTKIIAAHTLAYITAVSGINFTLITLITGILWGKLSWGSYLAWDARLVSVFFLFILYFIYLIITLVLFEGTYFKTLSSFIAIIGFINIPIIKYSVDWWNTLHQSSSITSNYIAIDYSIFIPLILMYLALIFFTIHIICMFLKKIYLVFIIRNYF